MRLSITGARTLRRDSLRFAGSSRARSRPARQTPIVVGRPLYQTIAAFHDRNGSPSWNNRRNIEKAIPKKYVPRPNRIIRLPKKNSGGSFRTCVADLAAATSRIGNLAAVYFDTRQAKPDAEQSVQRISRRGFRSL